MFPLVLSLLYLTATIVSMAQSGGLASSADPAWYLLFQFVVLFAAIGLLTRMLFQLRSTAEDWTLLRRHVLQPTDSLSATDQRELESIREQVYRSFLFAGVMAGTIYWRSICEENNPFDLEFDKKVSLLIPALLPIFPFLLWEALLNRLTRPTSSESRDPAAFWRICVQILALAMTFLGNMHRESASEDYHLLLFLTGFGVPIIVFTMSRLYRLFRSTAEGANS